MEIKQEQYYHIAQCNLSKYDLISALQDGKEEFDWKSSYVVNSPLVGDLVLIKTLKDTRSSSQRKTKWRIPSGIYAIGIVTESTSYRKSIDTDYHLYPDNLKRLHNRFRLKLVQNIVDFPLLCSTIKNNEDLSDVRGLTHSVNGSLCRISKHSFDKVLDMIFLDKEEKEPTWYQKICDKINLFLIKYPIIYDSIIRL